MGQITSTVDIAAPVERVWEAFSDPYGWPGWIENTVAILSVEGEPLAEGTTYRERSVVMGPWKSDSRWKVTRFQPHSIQVHEGHLSGVGGLVLTVGFEPAGEEGTGTRFSMALRYDTILGPLGTLLDRLMVNRMMQRSFDRSVRSFKLRVEASQGG
jgi:uncharacterized protein YndB with AHSA1/START domain